MRVYFYWQKKNAVGKHVIICTLLNSRFVLCAIYLLSLVIMLLLLHLQFEFIHKSGKTKAHEVSKEQREKVKRGRRRDNETEAKENGKTSGFTYTRRTIPPHCIWYEFPLHLMDARLFIHLLTWSQYFSYMENGKVKLHCRVILFILPIRFSEMHTNVPFLSAKCKKLATSGYEMQHHIM